MEKFSITLPAEMAEYVRAQVAAGHYDSDEAFFRAIVMREQTDQPDWLPSDDVMRAAIQESIDDPRPSLTEEEMDAFFDQRHAKALAAHSNNNA